MSQTPDLSHLPPAVQQKVQQMLAQIPEPMRKQVLAAGAPLLQKVIERATKEVMAAQGKGGKAAQAALKAAQHAATHATTPHGQHAGETPVHMNPRSAPHGHYNATIQPGDRMSLRGVFFFGVILFLAVAWFMQ